MTNATSKEGLATLRRALNGAMVSMIEASPDHHDGVVLILEGDEGRRVTLWVDNAERLRVDVATRPPGALRPR